MSFFYFELRPVYFYVLMHVCKATTFIHLNNALGFVFFSHARVVDVLMCLLINLTCNRSTHLAAVSLMGLKR